MKFTTPQELISSHIQDMVDSCGGDSSICANIAQATLLSILMTATGGDIEQVQEELKGISAYTLKGLDNGELRYEVYQ